MGQRPGFWYFNFTHYYLKVFAVTGCMDGRREVRSGCGTRQRERFTATWEMRKVYLLPPILQASSECQSRVQGDFEITQPVISPNGLDKKRCLSDTTELPGEEEHVLPTQAPEPATQPQDTP